MAITGNKVLSASRRTDIPAFYMGWFMKCINDGYFIVTNPYNGKTKKVQALPELIHSIVFWSKNYDRFIESRAGEHLEKAGFNLYFNFTVNSQNRLLEPGLPMLDKRLDQLKKLAQRFGPQKIAWRFDPVCFFKTGCDTDTANNLADFELIAQAASDSGITKCVTSFFDDYAKIRKRLALLKQNGLADIEFTDPSIKKKKQIILRMQACLDKKGIKLHLCCENQLLREIGPDTKVLAYPRCDVHLLKNLFGGAPETAKDTGQRSKSGCCCTKSIDIGSYKDHPCFHNCLFCYASPAMDRIAGKTTEQ